MSSQHDRRRCYRFDSHAIYQQNFHGAKSDAALGELIANAKRREAFAIGGQESWRAGNEAWEQAGYTFIGAAPAKQLSRRGSKGVGVLLSRRAHAAWDRGGHEKHAESDRLLGVRLVVRCGRRGRQYRRQMGIFLITAYAPTSGHVVAEHDAFYDGFTRLLARAQPGDVVVVCLDGNASIGRGSLGGDSEAAGRTGTVGPFGLDRVNATGRRLRGFMETHQLASLASFFRKPHYSTWVHPRTQQGYQLDHILMTRAEFGRCSNAGSCPFQLINSDHRAIGCRLRFESSLQRKVATARAGQLRLDCSALYERDSQRAFAARVTEHVQAAARGAFAQCSVDATADGRVRLAIAVRRSSPDALPPLSQLSGHRQIDPLRPSLTQQGCATAPLDSQAVSSRDYMRHAAYAQLRVDYREQHGSGWWNDDHLFHRFEAECRELALANAPTAAATATAAAAVTTATPAATTPVPYSILAAALEATALEMLPTKAKPQPDWFTAREAELIALIAARDTALNAHHTRPTRETSAARTRARAALQAGIRAARSAWVVDKCRQINDGIVAQRGTAAAWALVSELRDGLCGAKRRSAPAKMRLPDGTLASSPEENASVFAAHFEKLYGRTASFDASVPELLRQRPVAAGLDHAPTDREIQRALGKLRDTGPGDSGLVARLWKSLGSTDESFDLVRSIVHAFWESEEMPIEWETGLLKILPKKGDKSDPGNYRGIMLLEVAYKIVANIMHMRLQMILESPDHVDHEPQCGFRSKRGTCDASFTVKQMIKKRREHGLETWVLFIDLVKAFDRVPRDAKKKPPAETERAAEAASDEEIGMLWRVLLKFGVPPKLVRILIAMHQTVNVKFDIDGVTRSLLSIIGVKQGDLLGPELFDFYIAAIMETWRSTHTYELCTFRTCPDFQMTGRRPNAAGESISIGDSEYADDTGMPFCSRRDVEEQTPGVMAHFDRWGMEIHAGISDPLVSSGLLDHSALPAIKGSKSEVLFCAKPLHMYRDASTFDGADLSPIMLPNHGFMQVVDEFPYLGDIVARDGSDARAVDARLESGCRAFGALRGCIFASASVTTAAKRAVYEAIVISISLYGCETWSLTETLYDRLRVAQAQHFRAMCRVTRTHTWQHRISTQALGQQLGLDSIDMYIARRQLRWLGHVSRMDFESRLPRRMLSSWVPHARPPGAPTMTYGRSVCKAMAKFGIDPMRWHELAADRVAWRNMLKAGVAPLSFQPLPPPQEHRDMVAAAAARAVAKSTAAMLDAAQPPPRRSLRLIAASGAHSR